MWELVAVWVQKPVLSLCMLEDGTLLSGGGAEIKAWDSMNYFKRVKERTVTRQHLVTVQDV